MPYLQWAEMTDGVGYVPAGKTVAELKPGYYDLAAPGGQLVFVPVRARDDALLRFPDSASVKVMDGIEEFWNREQTFAKYGLPFKRGILLYGPPGSGKTCTLQLVSRRIVERDGVVINFHTDLFLVAYRAFRDIQPETPMVVLMEDFETTVKAFGAESKILNLLDGVERLHKVVFLATTNYPEKLDDRIVNRPSRFDLRVRIDPPTELVRAMYLKSLLLDGDTIDIARYVSDTDGLSLAHIKELFVATHILGASYDDAIARLRDMATKKVSSTDDPKPGARGALPGMYV